MRRTPFLMALTVLLVACPDQGGNPPPPVTGYIGGVANRSNQPVARPAEPSLSRVLGGPGMLETRAASAQASAQAFGFQADWSLPHVPNQILLVSRDGQIVQQGMSGTRSLRNLKVQTIGSTMLSVQVPSGVDEATLSRRLEQETGLRAQPNYRYMLLGTANPNDPERSRQTYLAQIRAPEAWVLQTDGVKVAVIDTGADLTHEDLQGRVVAGKDFCPRLENNNCVGQDDNPSDEDGHGTHTAGIIGAATDNARGVAGITQAGQLLIVKAFGTDALGTGGTTVSIANSINYAREQGARVMNLSLGIPASASVVPDAGVDAAIQAADNAGIVIVASSGNANGPLFYPASNPRVLAVASVNASNQISSFSARGTGLDLVAPGEGALSAQRGGGYELRTGTSEAAPMVSATASLMFAKNTRLTGLQVKDLLRTSATKLGNGECNETFGCGLLNVVEAVRRATSEDRPSEATDRTIYVFADRYVGPNDPEAKQNGNNYDPNNPNSAVTTVVLRQGQTRVDFRLDQNRVGKPLEPGTYTLVACINQNGNNVLCDAGDLGGRGPINPATGRLIPIEYQGGAFEDADVFLQEIR